jgi:hypothetical protein
MIERGARSGNVKEINVLRQRVPGLRCQREATRSANANAEMWKGDFNVLRQRVPGLRVPGVKRANNRPR